MSEEKDDDEKKDQVSDAWSGLDAEGGDDAPEDKLDFLDALSEELSEDADRIEAFADLSPSDAAQQISSELQGDEHASASQAEQGGSKDDETTHASDDDVADWLSEQVADATDGVAEHSSVEPAEETPSVMSQAHSQIDSEGKEVLDGSNEHDGDHEGAVSSIEVQEHSFEGVGEAGSSESDTTNSSEPVDEADAIAGWLDTSANDSAVHEQVTDIDLADGKETDLSGEGFGQDEDGLSDGTLENLKVDSEGSESVAAPESMDDFNVAFDGGGDSASTVSLSEADVATALGKGNAKRKSKVGVLGPVLGGVLSIPVVFLILLGVLWGTGRDPIQMRSWLPSILLPAMSDEREVVANEGPSLDDISEQGSPSSGEEVPENPVEKTSSTDQSSDESAGDGELLAAEQPSDNLENAHSPEDSSMDNIITGNDSPNSPAGGSDVPSTINGGPDSIAMINEPSPVSLEDPLLAVPPEMPSLTVPSPVEVAVVNPTIPISAPEIVSPQAISPPEPQALDYSSLEDAVESALLSMAQARETLDGDEADHRRALVFWYKDLARVGEEFAILEAQASDSGRIVDDIPDSITTLYESLGSADVLDAPLKRLCRNWVDYSKRPDEGVLLIGMLDNSREVGPFWNSILSLEMFDGSMREVLVISRRKPRAAIGERVAVAGIVFSENSVWAADCGPLHVSAGSVPPSPEADEKSTVQFEDPFGENPF